jgi:mycothiol synthase
VLHLKQLTSDQQTGVLALIKSATYHDGIPPIADHILLHLRHGGDKSDSHLVILDNQKIIGYAHLDQTDLVAGPAVELVVDPDHRQSGIGNQLLSEAIKICGTRLRLWSHGDLPVASKLAIANNFIQVRTVIQMSKSLGEITPISEIDNAITIRTFLPGLDSDNWLTLNNKAFTNHPEQGNWSINDLNLRLKEDWFDEKGFFIAEKDNQMIGFTWTKIHGATSHQHDDEDSHDHPAIGEIYITAISPSFEGGGIGKALTITALNYLKYQGLNQVILYVDEENNAAINLYQSLGFKEFGKDLLFKLQLA